MHIYYIANVRMPTEKAHGLTIAKSCEALARAGVGVTLIVPRRKTNIKNNIFENYGIEKNFTVRYIPTLDLLRISSARWAFWGSWLAFYISTLFTLLSIPKKNAVLYTREASLLKLSIVGLPAVLECHHVFSKKGLYFWLAHRAKKIITISQSIKAKFIAAGFKESTILVSPSGVDLSIFSKETPQSEARKELVLPIDKKIIMYTGNFTTMGADKGIHDILQALARIPDALFVGVGGREEDIAHYNEEAHSLGVADRVCFIGSQLQKTIALYQRAADILLMPFPDTEHYRTNMSPVKMFEYMASGRPIIASDLPTIREVLNEKNAVIVSPGDPRALADAINSLSIDRERGEVLAAQAKKDVRAYSWDERAKRILSFIA